MADLNVNSIGDASGGTTATVNGFTPTVSNMAGRNRIINGDMRIDQRNAGAAVTYDGSAGYSLDRYFSSEIGNGSFTIQQVSDAPAGFSKSLKVVVTGAQTGTLNASTLHAIEGYNVADLAWGTADAKPVTLSFWVKSSVTGTLSGVLQNSASNRSYPFTYSVSSASAWEYKTITIAGDTSGTWATDNTAGLWIRFTHGSSQTGTSGAWAGADYRGATGATYVIETLNATWQVTGVQLEAGSVATPFEHRQYGQELALCQRYYEKSYNIDVVPSSSTSVGVRLVSNAGGTSSNRFFGELTYAVPKRAQGVSITFYTQTGTAGYISKYNASSTTLAVSSIGSGYGENKIGVYIQTSTGDTSEPYVFHFTASSEL